MQGTSDRRPDRVFIDYRVSKPGDPPTPILKKRSKFDNDTGAQHRPLRPEHAATARRACPSSSDRRHDHRDDI
jgi:hypothetical protein